MREGQRGDRIEVRDIKQVPGVAIGRGARTGHLPIVSGKAAVDPAALQAELKVIYTTLNQANLPNDAKIVVQSAAGPAVVEGVKNGQAKPDVILPRIQEFGETLREAQVVVREETALWQSINALTPLLGPLVGGSRVDAGRFDLSLPG
jgi:hypothetical protein